MVAEVVVLDLAAIPKKAAVQPQNVNLGGWHGHSYLPIYNEGGLRFRRIWQAAMGQQAHQLQLEGVPAVLAAANHFPFSEPSKQFRRLPWPRRHQSQPSPAKVSECEISGPSIFLL